MQSIRVPCTAQALAGSLVHRRDARTNAGELGPQSCDECPGHEGSGPRCCARQRRQTARAGIRTFRLAQSDTLHCGFDGTEVVRLNVHLVDAHGGSAGSGAVQCAQMMTRGRAAAVMRASAARPRQAPTFWRPAQARSGSATHGVLAGRTRLDREEAVGL